jgi:hypothetical protein
MLLESDGSETHIADNPDRGWFSRNELETLGIPAPVRKLLASLPLESATCEPSTA